MRRKRLWVVWCVVVVVALLALASPGLQAQGALRAKAAKSIGACTVVNEWMLQEVINDAEITQWFARGETEPYKVVCKGTLYIENPTTVPVRWDDANTAGQYKCDIVDSHNWYETISRKGRVTLTCYR